MLLLFDWHHSKYCQNVLDGDVYCYNQYVLPNVRN